MSIRPTIHIDFWSSFTTNNICKMPPWTTFGQLLDFPNVSFYRNLYCKSGHAIPLNREESKRLSTFASCQPTSATSSIQHTVSRHILPQSTKKTSLKLGHLSTQRDWGGEIAVKHGGKRRLWHTSKLKENLSKQLLTDDLVGKWVRERHSARSISLFTPLKWRKWINDTEIQSVLRTVFTLHGKSFETARVGICKDTQKALYTLWKSSC